MKSQEILLVKKKMKYSYLLLIVKNLHFGQILVRYLHYWQISALSLKYLYYFSKISDIYKKSLKTFSSLSAKDIPSKIICYFYQIKIYHANISVICYLQKKKANRLFPNLNRYLLCTIAYDISSMHHCTIVQVVL